MRSNLIKSSIVNRMICTKLLFFPQDNFKGDLLMEVLLTVLLASSLPSFRACTDLKVVDLTYSYDNMTVNFPGSAPFRWTKKWAGKSPEGIWYSSNDFGTGEHTGTHMDAPYHFNMNGRTIDEIPIERFFVTGILINATLETDTNYLYKLPVVKLIEWERLHGLMPDNCLVFVNFGWAKKFYPNRKLYIGPTDNDFRFPGLSREAALWLARTKRVVGVAVDSPSADQGINTDAHVIFADNDMYIIENVKLLEPLPPKFQAIVMPMKLRNGTGAPVRVIAKHSMENYYYYYYY